jgi:hypothetical protein
MAAAITPAAPLPRKVELALQFNGIAPIQESQRKSSFCHAEHGRLTTLALSIRRVCHANKSAERESDTKKWVSQGLVIGKAAEDRHHEGSSDAVTNRACLAAQQEVSR